MPVEVDRAVKSLLYRILEDDFRLDGSHDGGCFGTEVYPPMSLTTAMGSVLVGDATSDFRGFRIRGVTP